MVDIVALNKSEILKTKQYIYEFPWSDAKAYACWLVQTHAMVNHSTRLVALAGAYAELDRNDMHARFVDHSHEERGHQLVAVSDLKALGYTLKDFPKLPESEAMYQIQYYWIQHRGASSFFGYTLALETLASEFGAFIYDSIKKAHGPTASKFLKLHSAADVEHLEKAYEQISKLTPHEADLVAENLILSASLYRSMLQSVTALYAGKSVRKGA